jgi:tetratricopeptide (TPR) repeat protein
MKTSLALLLALFIVASPAVRAQDKVDAAKASVKNGDFLKAIEDLRDFARKEKRNSQAFYWLGVAYLGADSLDQSVAALIQAREIDTANARIYETLGDAYTKQRLAEAAIQQYKRASEIDSSNVPLLMKLGDANRKARKYTEAAAAYHQVVRLDSTNEQAITELSTLYVRAKQWKAALAPLRMLARMKPAAADVQMNFFRALSEVKDYPAIIPQAKIVLASSPGNLEVILTLAEAYTKTAQKDSAAAVYALVNPDSMSRAQLIEYAKVLRTLDQPEKATDIMERAFRKDTAACDVPYELGTLYMKMKRWNDAIAMFEKKLACDTSVGFQFASHLNEGMSMMQLKDFKDALVHILAAVEKRPDNVQAWQTLAQDYAQLGNDEKKVEAYQKVLELIAADTTANGKYDNQKAEANRMIGVQMLLDKKYAKAVDYLTEALKSTPKDCQTLLWIAQANQNSNKKDEAKKFYCRVIKTCPNSQQAKDADKGLEVLGLKCDE